MSEDPNPTQGEDGYEIGYKRPPKSTQFRKGQSGNPRGRPKKKQSEKSADEQLIPRAIMKKVLGETMKVRTEKGEIEYSKLEAYYTKLTNAALKGDQHAQRQLNQLLKHLGLTDIPEPAPKKRRGLIVRFANVPPEDRHRFPCVEDDEDDEDTT